MKIYTCRLSEDLIEFTARFLNKNFKKDDFSKVAVIFGGRRPALFLRKKLSSLVKKPFFPPAFFTLSDFGRYLLASRLPFRECRDLEACFIIYQIIKDKYPVFLGRRKRFADFLLWAKEIVAFIDQLDLEMVDEGAIRNIEKQAGIGWDVPEGVNFILSSILKIRQDFHHYLKSRNIYTRGLIVKTLIENQDSIDTAGFSHLVFSGLFYLYKGERKLLAAVGKKAETTFIIQSDTEIAPKDLTAYFSLKQKAAYRMPNANISLFSAADKHQEAVILYNIMNALEKDENTVVVMPEPDNAPVYLAPLSRQLGKFNVSFGYPLSRTQIFSLFHNIFRLQAGYKNALYYAKDYLKVLAHPLCKGIIFSKNNIYWRVIVHAIENWLRKFSLQKYFVELKEIENSEFILAESVRLLAGIDCYVSAAEVKEAIAFMHSLFLGRWQHVDSLAGFADTAKDLLGFLLQESYFGRDKMNLKASQHLFDLFKQIMSLDFDFQGENREEIFKLAEDILKGQVISFSGSPLSGLQVLGFFETRNIKFKNVVIMDLNEGSLPYLRRVYPLVPLEVMRRLEINRPQKEEEIQRYHFRRLISGAENVFLIFEENKKKTRSRFVEELVWEKEKRDKRKDALPVKSNFVFSLNFAPRTSKEEKSKEVVDFLSKGFVYSASALDTYIKCPLRFYYHYVLRLKEQEDISRPLDALKIGEFIHSFLEEAYGKILMPKPVFNKNSRKEFFGLFERRFSETFPMHSHSEAFILKEIMLLRLNDFWEHEQNRKIEEVLLLEEEFRFLYKTGGNNYDFVAKIDRLDKIENNRYLIIDYKTGVPSDRRVNLEKGIEALIKDNKFSLQLPMYIYALRQQKGFSSCALNAAWYYFRGNKMTYLLTEEDSGRQEEQAVTALTSILDRVLPEITDINIPFYADKSNERNCDSCPYKIMCS